MGNQNNSPFYPANGFPQMQAFIPQTVNNIVINNFAAPQVSEFHPSQQNFYPQQQQQQWENQAYGEEEGYDSGDVQKCSFEFPDGGWECNKCQNYNFKGRKECYRCKKAKSSEDAEGKPEHMLKPEKLVNKKKSKIMKR